MAVTLSAALNALASTSAPDKVIVLEGSTAKQTDPSNIGGGYLKYVALLSQTGTGAPTAVVLENTLGGTVVWTRSGVGDYRATLSGVFTENKTWCTANAGWEQDSVFQANLSKLAGDNDICILYTTDSTGTQIDDFFDMSIEIRVYP
jgi:hypothetical protein